MAKSSKVAIPAHVSSETKEIVLDLTADTKQLPVDQLIHRQKYSQILAIINDLMDKGEGYNEQSNYRRVHNIITLSGSRGVGKTTLLRAVFRELNVGEKYCSVQPLGIIDPTMIEEKGHIFLNIIALIRREVLNNVGDSDHLESSGWNKALKELAGGLPQLDGVQGGLNPGDWNDPQFVMFTGLEGVDSAMELEKNFHKFIRLSLELLDKKYFALFFDDVDNDFAKGWPVLEILRKYLTTPQLIIMISGDMDLFSYVVRKKQWENFGKALLKNEFDKKSGHLSTKVHDYSQMVEELESQYLIKLMPPRYRITLDSVLVKVMRGERIMIKESDDEPNINIRDFYTNRLSSYWGIQSLKAKYDFSNLFLSLPIRSQIQLMLVFRQNPPIVYDASRNASKALADIFYSELKAAEVDVWEMINEYGEINIYILRFMIETMLFDEVSQLYPKLNDPRLDCSVTTLGCLLADRFSRRPYEFFDYIIRISYLVSKSHWPTGLSSKVVKNKISDKPTILGLIDHAYLLFDYGMRKMASLQSAYSMSFVNYSYNTTNPTKEGLIPIYGPNNAESPINEDSKDDEKKPINKVFSRNDLSYALAMIPTSAFQGSDQSTYMSFYNLIASIGELLYCDATLINKELHKLTTFRVYPSYYWVQDYPAPGGETTISDPDLGPQEFRMKVVTYKGFVNSFAIWRKTFENSKICLPPYVLGRGMVRTQKSFTRIITTGLRVGEILHRMLVVFLNAVLVEEQNERGDLKGIRLSNPVNSDDLFIENLYTVFNSKKDGGSKESYLSYHLLTCPLILAYIDPDTIDKFPFKTSIKYKYREGSNNIYMKLNSMSPREMSYAL